MNKELILLVWDRMGDYHRVRWKALASLAGRGHVFAADLGTADQIYRWENTLEQENYFLLSEKPVDKTDLLGRLGRFRAIMLSKQVDTVCIPGYGRVEYLLFILLAKIYSRKVVLFAESWYGDNQLKNLLKSVFLRRMVDFFFVSGERAHQHFSKKLKISSNSIFKGYSVIDNAHFLASEAVAPDRPVMLCVARFSEEKNLTGLIKAFLQSEISNKYTLKLVGGGPQKAMLTDMVPENAPIVFEDWLSYEQLPALYHQATIFILPSFFEPWGLVVNEAMAAGLPVIVSIQCGCVPDLITPNNGFIFDATSKDDLKQLLNNVACIHQGELHQMGKASQRIIQQYSPLTWANTLMLALKSDNI